MNILLVEDDAVIADAIRVYLGNSLMQVTHAATLGEAKHYLTACQFDICLLDIALPDGSGLSLIKFARKYSQGLPVILLTAKDARDDKIQGLNTGADDYITKPFDFEELMARINSVYRRSTRQLDSFLRHGNLHYDLANKVVKLNDKRLALSASESKLLIAFLLVAKIIHIHSSFVVYPEVFTHHGSSSWQKLCYALRVKSKDLHEFLELLNFRLRPSFSPLP